MIAHGDESSLHIKNLPFNEQGYSWALIISPSLRRQDRATIFNISSGIKRRDGLDYFGLLRHGQFGIDGNGDGFVGGPF